MRSPSTETRESLHETTKTQCSKKKKKKYAAGTVTGIGMVLADNPIPWLPSWPHPWSSLGDLETSLLPPHISFLRPQ